MYLVITNPIYFYSVCLDMVPEGGYITLKVPSSINIVVSLPEVRKLYVDNVHERTVVTLIMSNKDKEFVKAQ